jgi:hypothetical protein
LARCAPVTLAFVEGLVGEGQALGADIKRIGRFYLADPAAAPAWEGEEANG